MDGWMDGWTAILHDVDGGDILVSCRPTAIMRRNPDSLYTAFHNSQYTLKSCTLMSAFLSAKIAIYQTLDIRMAGHVRSKA